MWPIVLTASKPSRNHPDRVSVVRWRDARGQEGQSSIGEIVHQVDEGRTVKLGDETLEVIDDGDQRLLVVDGRTDPISR